MWKKLKQKRELWRLEQVSSYKEKKKKEKHDIKIVKVTGYFEYQASFKMHLRCLKALLFKNCLFLQSFLALQSFLRLVCNMFHYMSL